MIFYFSGTGNSLQVAKAIGKENNLEVISIASIMNNKKGCYSYELKEQEPIGFVFPVYAWGPPWMVLKFIDKLKLTNYKNNYSFTVVTCGANIGNTLKLIQGSMKKKQMSLNSGFSIVMPNNYIIMGDVDSKEIEKQKLIGAEKSIEEINKIINEKRDGEFKVLKGRMPSILTSVINPLFNKNAMKTKKFYANDKCTACGICENVCNSNCIKVIERPHWEGSCSQCLACINFCPVHAIQYGKGTEKKGRYRNPNISIEEMKVNFK